MNLLKKKSRLAVSLLFVAAIVVLALDSQSAFAQSQQCTNVYNSCMKNVNSSYNLCMQNIEDSCNAWSTGSMAWQYCEIEAQQQEQDQCYDNLFILGQSQCQAAEQNCENGTGKVTEPADRFLERRLPVKKLLVVFESSGRRTGSTSL